jgi:hypothetical protein
MNIKKLKLRTFGKDIDKNNANDHKRQTDQRGKIQLLFKHQEANR